MPTVVVHGVILPLRCKVIFHSSVSLLPKLRLQLSRSFWVSVSVYQSQLCLLSTLLGEQLHSLLSPAPPLFNLIYGFLPLKNLHFLEHTTCYRPFGLEPIYLNKYVKKTRWNIDAPAMSGQNWVEPYSYDQREISWSYSLLMRCIPDSRAINVDQFS